MSRSQKIVLAVIALIVAVALILPLIRSTPETDNIRYPKVTHEDLLKALDRHNSQKANQSTPTDDPRP